MDQILSTLMEYKIIVGSGAAVVVLLVFLLMYVLKKKPASPVAMDKGKNFDGLTGLLNRESMMKIAQMELGEARNRKMQLDLYFLPGPGQAKGTAVPHVNINADDLDVLGIFSCAVLDIDEIGRLNETYGSTMGDTVIMRLSRLIMDQNIFKAKDIRGSMDGGRFIIIFPGIPSSYAAERVENFKAKWINEVFITDQKQSFASSFCCGIAHFTSQDGSIRSVLDRAEIALGQAKAERPGTVKVFKEQSEDSNPNTGGFSHY